MENIIEEELYKSKFNIICNTCIYFYPTKLEKGRVCILKDMLCIEVKNKNKCYVES